MDSLSTPVSPWLRRLCALPLLCLSLAAPAFAQTQAVDPPGRVAVVTQQLGSVVYAPAGEDEWTELPPNRPLTRGDRLWTDAGARAELHVGSGAIHLDSQSQLALFELDDNAIQLSLTQGTANLRVRDLAPRENVEVDTPNLALRAAQPGDFRIDVDPARGTTRIAVRGGEAIVYGQGGESVRLGAGQSAVFEGRDLRQSVARGGLDEFDQWVGELNRRDDLSVSARYVPREVIGYQALDNYGAWSTDPSYGAVWFPRVTVADWAPYRYGHWEFISPWGWTWVDEAPWGFAPFHYGRWAVIGTRWAWVPGRLGPRPLYAPALVGFVGGGGFTLSLSFGAGPGIGWYPLAPGELWVPTYQTTNIYITNINRNIGNPRRGGEHFFRSRTDAVTAVRVEDFNRGRRVHENFRPLRPNEMAQLQGTTTLPRPERPERGLQRQPRLVATPPAAVAVNPPPNRIVATPPPATRRDESREERREEQQRERPAAARRPVPVRPEAVRPEEPARQQPERAQREQAQREQATREQHDQAQRRQQEQRDAREQAQRAQQEQRAAQREQALRQQQEQRAAREQVQREQQQQRAAQREEAVRQQQERAQRKKDAEAAQRERDRNPGDDDEDRKRRGRGG